MISPKRLMVEGLVFVFVLAMFIPFSKSEQPLTILGQNNPSVDVQAIQTAVDQGGAILLKGTFDFGDKGRINIRKDVKIVGENDGNNTPVTKIKGGFWTFHSPLPAKLPPEIPGPKITIQSIRFDGALWCPIHLAYSSGTVIIGNKITNVRPILSPFPIFGKEGLNTQQGIICSPRYAQPTAPQKFQQGAFTGILTIADNEIDMLNEEPVKTMAQGVLVIWTTGVTAQILRNTIFHCSRNSVEVLDNYLSEDGRGLVVIQGNKIVTSQMGLPVPTPGTPNGILAGWFVDMSGGADPKRNIKHIILHNAIRVRGQTSGGIISFTDGAVIESNALAAENQGSIAIFSASSNSYIAQNKIEGIGGHGLMVRPWGPLKGTNNLLVNNDFTSFKATAVDVSLDKGANNNVLFGKGGTIKDFGSGNQITGLKPLTK